MRTARPTTRPTLSFNQLRTHSLDMLFSRFRFLHRGRPANPLITRERRQVVPRITCRLAGSERFPQIGGHLMHHARGEPCFRHGFLGGDYRHREPRDRGEIALRAAWQPSGSPAFGRTESQKHVAFVGQRQTTALLRRGSRFESERRHQNWPGWLELGDTADSKPAAERRGGSTPLPGTTLRWPKSSEGKAKGDGGQLRVASQFDSRWRLSSFGAIRSLTASSIKKHLPRSSNG